MARRITRSSDDRRANVDCVLSQHERKRAVEAEADARYEEIQRTGMTIDWDDMRRYVLARARGEQAARPVPRNRAVR